MLTLLGAALVSGQRSVRAAGQRVEEHAEELRAPLRAVDAEALERCLAARAAGQGRRRPARRCAGPTGPAPRST